MGKMGKMWELIQHLIGAGLVKFGLSQTG